MKVAIFENNNVETLQDEINKFLADKILDIVKILQTGSDGYTVITIFYN